ncbi:MAG: hypothetical protein PWP07_1151 [Epulopiscium sp.]|jgi:hypothetical protein|uniref:Uncharacterized protein n=1 Tax=Defluviitalea raffinosedens TaxID=1450156 RepID=A0A7C8LD26_9FIRM|nr:hypothetical protein [Defluviitalea raffinosedens]MBZ4668010.1 hypothetical protein [Defluviitaleaceae bacterium]MDK2787926.1 hypothetical protein [Candidatus Epulonipiscium sp.]KAE9635425.1 hypothetical protein GND95_04565 [Defluviitalea raffinosedens]MBM7684329.1 hypothetical protein [Defluviitalea raffinosedens]HHW67605.1 hypothetical protein [Candidatus Epulonipiscium sp.]
MSNNQLLQNLGGVLGTNIDLQQDLNEIREMIRNKFKEKYINKIESLIQGNRIQAQENPTKEIALLQAIKPFINPDIHVQIDKCIDVMNTYRTFQNISQQVKAVQFQSNESGENNGNNGNKKDRLLIQDDGVYEIDEQCLNSKSAGIGLGNGEFLIFILLLLFLSNSKFNI